MPVYFLRRHRKGVNSDGRGYGKKLRGVGGGETVIRISKNCLLLCILYFNLFIQDLDFIF